MRTVLFVPGVIVLIVGALLAVQGAGLLVKELLVGPLWIAAGVVVAIVGAALIGLSFLKPKAEKEEKPKKAQRPKAEAGG